MTARPPAAVRAPDIVRAVTNLAWTTAITAGSPLILARTFGNPLPRQMPDWSGIALTPMRLVEPQVIVNATACLAWLAWAIVAVYVAIDIADLARGVGHRARRLGPATVVSGKLVASLALLLSLTRPQPTPAIPAPPVATGQLVVPDPATSLLDISLAGSLQLAPPATARPTTDTTVPAPPTRTYDIRRGDSLWRIAEQQLGDGFRWREIYDLNRETIADPDLIRTGSTLTIPTDPGTQPADALTPAPGPPTPPADASPEPAAPTPPTTAVPTPAPTNGHTPQSTAAEPTEPTESPAPHTTEPRTTVASMPTTTLPLALRAQGFETQEQYDEWLRQHQAAGPAAGDGSAWAHAVTLLATVTISGLLAAGIVAAIDRRRRRVLQHRPRHAPPPPRDARQEPAERALRDKAPDDADEQIDRIDLALRLLSAGLDEHETARLLLVRPSAFGVELLWDRPPDSPCPPGFHVAGGPHSWELPATGDDLDELREQAAGHPPHVQALVTLGDTPEGPVLINLEALNHLDLIGTPEAIEGWINATAVELATHRWAEHVTTSITQPAPPSARLITTLTPHGGRPAPHVTAVELTETAASWTLDLAAHEAVLINTELDLTLTVAPSTIPPELREITEQLLTEAEHDPYRTSGTSVRVDTAADTAPTDPETSHEKNLHVEPPGEPTAPTPSRDQDAAAPGDTLLLSRTAQHDAIAALESTDRLVVRVLGPVHTSGWKIQPRLTRTEALLVNLAISRPDPVSPDRILNALWAGKAVTPKSVYNTVTNLRRDAGDPNIVTKTPDGYRLSKHVLTDWDAFRTLTDQASAQPWPARRDTYRAALDLVQGRPFDGATKDHTWATTDGTITRIEIAITDAAEQLAADAIEQGDARTAIWAARQALRACPWHLRMYAYIIQAHALDGDVTAIEHTWRELQRAATDEDIPSEVTDVYERHRH